MEGELNAVWRIAGILEFGKVCFGDATRPIRGTIQAQFLVNRDFGICLDRRSFQYGSRLCW
jgi:hypothetical protein